MDRGWCPIFRHPSSSMLYNMTLDHSKLLEKRKNTPERARKPHQQMLAAEHARLPRASATPLPKMLPRADRLVTALEKRRIINATVDKIVCAHQDSQLT